jgi:hypothetical protein
VKIADLSTNVQLIFSSSNEGHCRQPTGGTESVIQMPLSAPAGAVKEIKALAG